MLSRAYLDAFHSSFRSVHWEDKNLGNRAHVPHLSSAAAGCPCIYFRDPISESITEHPSPAIHGDGRHKGETPVTASLCSGIFLRCVFVDSGLVTGCGREGPDWRASVKQGHSAAVAEGKHNDALQDITQSYRNGTERGAQTCREASTTISKEGFYL